MTVLRPRDAAGLHDALAWAREHAGSHAASGVLARGRGRSYGDAAQLGDGVALDLSALNAFELDRRRGVLMAQAGATVGQLLAALVPAGWMLPVVPGTQHVSLGGAIAADVHGKNHGAVGTLGAHVLSLGLLTAAGETLALGPEDELFQATLGGMGLTGVVVWARVALQAVGGPMLSVDTDRVHDLEHAMAALRAPGGRLRVAWLDLLGPRPGRGFVTRAEHVDAPAPARRARPRPGDRGRIEVPRRWPGGLLRPSSVRAFNELRYRTTPRRERGRLQSITQHLFPLDGLEAWPRLYGRRGFLQYQVVVPYGSERALEAVLERLRRARVPCFLAVLKDFGPANSAPLSFPLAGWTLALDFPRSAAGGPAALEDCDRIVAEAGGRVYLIKDARLRPEMLRAMYPRLSEWQAVRDRADPQRLWASDLARRTGLLESVDP